MTLPPCLLARSLCDRPRVIESLRGVEVADVAAGGAHSACITASGELFTWGKGRYGRLGHGDSEDQLKPKLVTPPSWSTGLGPQRLRGSLRVWVLSG